MFNEPAHKEYRMFTQFSTSDAHEIFCLRLIRLDAILTSFVDSFRHSNRRTYETCIDTVINFEVMEPLLLHSQPGDKENSVWREGAF